MTVVHLRRAEPGLLVIAADGAPLVTDAAPALDVLVLDVVGGQLSWSLFDSALIPAAVLDDADAAQDWVWAVYGEDVALAVADNRPRTLTAAPARPESAAALRRLAYAHWAIRWWPASTIDAIPALDPVLLAEEIAMLTEQCEMMIDGAVDERFTEPDRETETYDDGAAPNDGIRESIPASSGDGEPSNGLGGRAPTDEAESIGRSRGRAEDYALAAGEGSSDGLIVARGSGGWDWRRCPPGILDAGEKSVSWQVARAEGMSTVRVNVVAAPACRHEGPPHLRPYARVRSADAGHDRTPPAHMEFTTPLRLRGDSWTGAVRIPGPPETSPDIAVFVPGVGPADPAEESAMRERIRRFARLRLTELTGHPRLSAETAAADADEDF
ncbi:hypothetical protein [Nocardia sp. NPDC058633]|uniref:hypothetical protein n=1 Tax=Nocardia sp. NPDC058633 TaxID=3346568 RepID=UPI003666BFFD